MTWLEKMPVGGKFLDESRNFVGTITSKSDTGFTWIWKGIDNDINFKPYSGTYVEYNEEELEENGWTPLTPLMEQLL